jgi:hypothetical protein
LKILILFIAIQAHLGVMRRGLGGPLLVAIAAALAAPACDLMPGGGTLGDDDPPPPSPPMPEPSPLAAPDASVPAEFPCDVRAVLETSCAPCHAGTTYTVEFKTRDALLVPWGDAGTFGQRAAALVAAGQMPPPSAQRFPTDDERAILIGWVGAGMPSGPCGPLTPPLLP